MSRSITQCTELSIATTELAMWNALTIGEALRAPHNISNLCRKISTDDSQWDETNQNHMFINVHRVGLGKKKEAKKREMSPQRNLRVRRKESILSQFYKHHIYSCKMRKKSPVKNSILCTKEKYLEYLWQFFAAKMRRENWNMLRNWII